ncbi:chloramphenicol phosphotransferase CPT family protein [Bauldia sp.]|uniref:chloramphenicol phosphotransferase CPT family protein n=1 Tax=Bauldia sp. TaxID=2575872 RepID=UPI003BA8DB5A
MSDLGQVVILNGAPRAGKSSIVTAIQDSFDGVWINLGVDVSVLAMTPKRYRPGIGLRPGGERPDLEPLVPVLYGALYDSIAAHSRVGLNVVAEFGHHDGHSNPKGILEDCARRLDGLPVLFVGVRCPVETIMERLRAGQPGRTYESADSTEEIPAPVRRYSEAVHNPGIYDIEVDTSMTSPAECAAAIRDRLQAGVQRPTAFERLAMNGI